MSGSQRVVNTRVVKRKSCKLRRFMNPNPRRFYLIEETYINNAEYYFFLSKDTGCVSYYIVVTRHSPPQLPSTK